MTQRIEVDSRGNKAKGCSKCGTTKRLGEFDRRGFYKRTGEPRYQSHCKECRGRSYFQKQSTKYIFTCPSCKRGLPQAHYSFEAKLDFPTKTSSEDCWHCRAYKLHIELCIEKNQHDYLYCPQNTFPLAPPPGKTRDFEVTDEQFRALCRIAQLHNSDYEMFCEVHSNLIYEAHNFFTMHGFLAEHHYMVRNPPIEHLLRKDAIRAMNKRSKEEERGKMEDAYISTDGQKEQEDPV